MEMGPSNASKAGVAIFVGSVQFSIGLILSEISFPNYNVSTNYVSDLGAFCPASGPCVIEPSALIYNTSAVLLGLLILVGDFFLNREFSYKPVTVIVAITAVGAMGVGLFPETTGVVHGIFSLVVFLFAGLTAIVTARLQRKPMFYFSIILGLFTLVALVLYIGGEYLGLGPGGMERMVVYPVLVWSIGFGGHMMAMN
jgi:hypothetical membrane protein